MSLTHDPGQGPGPRWRRLTSNGLNLAFMALLFGAAVHASVQPPEPFVQESSQVSPDSGPVASHVERSGRYAWDLTAAIA